MNLKAKISIVLAATILVAGAATGCNTQNDQAESMEALYALNVKEAPVAADPSGAIDGIYSSLDDYEAVEMNDEQLEKFTGINDEFALEVYGMRSDPKSVLADVIVVKPLPGVREEVRTMLGKYKSERMKEFENYDILDAYSISKSAVIYDQGEFLVLLMLEDNDDAQNIVDEYIPH